MSVPRLESLTPIVPAGPDVEATIAFYEKFLGFAVRFRDGSPTSMAFVHRDGVELMLQQTDDKHWASQTSYRIRVTGVEDFHREFVSRGGAVHPNGKLQKKPWGSTEFAVIDPFGVCLAFYEFLK
jgi:uncharacterized glyoxalase superfamily protein PhnB